MTYEELKIELAVDESLVENAVHANGFSIDNEFDGRKKNLIQLYTDYLIAMEDAREARLAFKYADGEESVDKSKVYDQYRRYANDLLALWTRQKKEYDDSLSGKESFFKIRRRAGFLDERTR